VGSNPSAGTNQHCRFSIADFRWMCFGIDAWLRE
jgi:hypothetical protein